MLFACHRMKPPSVLSGTKRPKVMALRAIHGASAATHTTPITSVVFTACASGRTRTSAQHP